MTPLHRAITLGQVNRIDLVLTTLVVDRTVAAVLSVVDRATVLVKGQVAYDGAPGTLAGDPALLGRYLGV